MINVLITAELARGTEVAKIAKQLSALAAIQTLTSQLKVPHVNHKITAHPQTSKDLHVISKVPNSSTWILMLQKCSL